MYLQQLCEDRVSLGRHISLFNKCLLPIDGSCLGINNTSQVSTWPQYIFFYSSSKTVWESVLLCQLMLLNNPFWMSSFLCLGSSEALFMCLCNSALSYFTSKCSQATVLTRTRRRAHLAPIIPCIGSQLNIKIKLEFLLITFKVKSSAGSGSSYPCMNPWNKIK